MHTPLVFVIGDSISIQYGPFLEEMLAPEIQLQRKQGDEAALQNLDIPQGANGGDSARVRTYLEAMCADATWAPDLLLLNCGLHDIKTNVQSGAKQTPLDDYEANLTAIISMLDARNITTLWLQTTPVDNNVHNKFKLEFQRFAEDVEAYNACANKLMTAAGIGIIDLFSLTRVLGGAEIFMDHCHFTPEVQRLQAAFLAGHCQQWFAQH